MKKIKIFGKELSYKNSITELVDIDKTISYTDSIIETIRNLGVCILVATILASFLPHSLGDFIFTLLLIVICFAWSFNVGFKFIRWYIKKKNIDVDKERSLFMTFIIGFLITGIIWILLLFALIPSLQTMAHIISDRISQYGCLE